MECSRTNEYKDMIGWPNLKGRIWLAKKGKLRILVIGSGKVRQEQDSYADPVIEMHEKQNKDFAG